MADQERHFLIDSFMLVAGILLGTAVGLAFMVRMIFFDIGGQLMLGDPEVAAAVASRIEPVGHVILQGSAELAAAVPPAAVPEPVTAVLTGPQVYNQACIACHSAAAAATGAPTVGDGAAWASRTAQGMDTLVDHALNGYTGEAGYMPPKGGQINLSDEEVIAAVEYMLEQLGQ